MLTRRRLTFLLPALLALALVMAWVARRGPTPPPVSTPLASSAQGRATATLAATVTGTVRPSATALPSATASPLPTVSPTALLVPAERIVAAQQAERIGDWARAFPLYDSLRDHPDFGGAALFALADLYARDERLSEAVQAWQTLIEREPDSPLADASRYRLASRLTSLGQHEGALALWQQFDSRNDVVDDVVALRLAEALRDSGQAEQAAAQRERIYESESAGRVARAGAARTLADFHAANQRWAEARLWYERTLALSEIRSYRAELSARIAEADAALGNEEAARTAWQSLLRDFADEPAALLAAEALAARGEPLPALQRGELYLANGRWGEAARAFFEALEEEDRPEAHVGAAQALAQGDNAAAAEREWQKLLDTHPEAATLHDDALLGVGRAQAAQGNAAAALETWERLLADFPESDAAPAALWERARLLQRSGIAEGAAASYERLAATFPNDDNVDAALFAAGLLHFEGTRYEAALSAFRTLAGREPQRPAQALFWAGKAAQAVGQGAQARRFWEQAQRFRTDYYALRAADLLTGNAWQARTVTLHSRPNMAELDWLREASGLAAGADLLALPDEPLLARGETLLLLGEREQALGAFLAAIRAHREEPQALWAMANHLHQLGLHSYSALAAGRLMELLRYDALNAPPALAALAYPLPFEPELVAAGEQAGLDPLFLAALIFQESRWEPRARSSAAARGLMQVIPDTGRWIAQRLGDSTYRYSDLDRPIVSLRYGSFYLDAALAMFADNPFPALAGYNGGPGNARRWLTPDDDLFVEKIALSETRRYVEEIYRHWHAYQRLYGP